MDASLRNKPLKRVCQNRYRGDETYAIPFPFDAEGDDNLILARDIAMNMKSECEIMRNLL